jgi:hypothetical protein
MKIVQVMLMYMSAVPVVLTLRTSTVIQDIPDEELLSRPDKRGRPPGHLVQAWRWLQRRNFLLRQASIVFVLTVIIAIIQDAALRTNPDFTIFALLYEVISGYGNVGFSLGYVNTTTSFSAVWWPASKVLLCILMLMGRHRGMPHHHDTAVMLVSRRRDVALAEQTRVATSMGQATAAAAAAVDLATAAAAGPTAPVVHTEVVEERVLDSEAVPRRRLVVRRSLDLPRRRASAIMEV